MAVEQRRPLTKRSERPFVGDVAPFVVAFGAFALMAFAAERLPRATAAVDGEGGWGRLDVSSMEDPSEEQIGTRQVLALLGAGERRYVVTCRERDAASTYLQLGAILAEKERLGAIGRG